MLAKKFRSLLNGGASEVGSDGLRAEIAALQIERSKHEAELAAIPARRAELLLSDDANSALDKLEAREAELYRFVERIDLQTAALRERVPDQGDAELRARIKYYRSLLMATQADIERAVLATVAANAAAFATIEDARRELGSEDTNRFLPLVHYAGSVITGEHLEFWRSNIETNISQIDARMSGRAR